jgi:hypothetical protein
MEVSMGLRTSMLFSAAVLLPLAGAEAQKGPPPTTPPTSPQSTAPGQMGTTPGQQQTTPGQAKEMTPAVTRQTPSGQAVPSGQATAPEVAAQVQVTKGATVYDTDGNIVGKVVSVDSKGAVVTTGTARATIALSGFSNGARGLTISRTKDQIEAAGK